MGEMGSMIAGGADYLTPTDFAHALGLSRGETVREWCAEGKIPGAFRVSDKGKGRWRIPLASLGEYVRQRQEELRVAFAPLMREGVASPALRQAQGPARAGDADSPAERGRVVGEIMRVFRRGEFRKRREQLVRDITERRKTCAEVREELALEMRKREAHGGWKAMKIPG
jgi:hypothetical protein